MKKIFLYVVIGIVLLAIPATVFLVGQRQDIRKRAAPATTLALTPAANTKAVGETFKLSVAINPGTNQVVSVKLSILFDGTKLEGVSITNGPLAPSVLSSGVIASSSATITVGAASNTQPITTPGTIAVLTLKAKAPTGPSQVSFGSDTYVGGLGETNVNELIPSGLATATVEITGAGVTPTITLTPTVTVTPSVTPTITTAPTLTPTLTPTPTATAGAEATTSAVQIIVPAANMSVTSNQPTIQGKAAPGATVTLTIYSTPQTVIVTADANGNWVYTPTTPLDPGPHNVVASVQSGATTQTATTAFVVAGAEAGATESAMPISGNIETTILLVGIGMLFFISGILIPIYIQ